MLNQNRTITPKWRFTMQSEEQRLIESLFSRLKQAQAQSGPRDAAADQLIKTQLQQQPDAPYYMAQSILIQEAAMKKLNDRVNELQNQLAQQQQPQQSSGGFLSGLFGGGQSRSSQPPQQQQQQQQQQWNNSTPPQAAAPAARGTGFLGGALQTAVGVAGGVVMADMLTSMFHHSQPQEIVNIINDEPLPDVSNNLDTFNQGDNDAFLNQNAGLPPDYANDFGNDDNFSDDFDDDSFV